MELVSIGEAAATLGIRTSALRYYDERGLVTPARRKGGRRYYGPAELRKLAFLQLLQQLDIDLEVAAAVFDPPSASWRESVREQIDALDALLVQAQVARGFLEHLLECPAEHPTRDCPTMTGILDQRVAGKSLEQLAKDHGVELPRRARKPRRPRGKKCR